MRMESLNLIEVADMPDQYRRAYDLSVNNDTLRALDYTLRNEGGQYRPAMLVDVLGNSIQLATDDVEHVQLDVGKWSDARYRFIAVVTVEEPTTFHAGSRLVVCGYTDRCDISYNKTVAPDLRFYINSIVGVRDLLSKDNRGNTFIKSMITENYQVMLGDFDQHNSRHNDYKMRPVDVFSTIETTRELGSSDDQTVDTRILFVNGVDTNSRRNNQRGRYLSSIIEQDAAGYHAIETYTDDEYGGNYSHNSAAVEMAANAERRIVSNHFIRYLTSNCRSDVLYNKYFNYEDMAALASGGNLRGLDDITTIVERARGSMSMESENWNGATTETIIAATLAQEIPSIMTDCIMSGVIFTCSNMASRDGRAEFICTSIHMFVPGDFGDHIINAFETRFINEVFRPLSQHGSIALDIQVQADVGGMTVVDIIIDNNANERYVFPSFCDSILAPTLTRDFKKIENLASQYETIREEIVKPIILNAQGTPMSSAAPIRPVHDNNQFLKLF